jgi:hypothetical protein
VEVAEIVEGMIAEREEGTKVLKKRAGSEQ